MGYQDELCMTDSEYQQSMAMGWLYVDSTNVSITGSPDGFGEDNSSNSSDDSDGLSSQSSTTGGTSGGQGASANDGNQNGQPATVTASTNSSQQQQGQDPKPAWCTNMGDLAAGEGGLGTMLGVFGELEWFGTGTAFAAGVAGGAGGMIVGGIIVGGIYHWNCERGH